MLLELIGYKNISRTKYVVVVLKDIPVMIVENHDGTDDTTGHHNHDARKVSTNQWSLT